MEIFPWDPNFETGIAVIDRQHQQLVGLLNRLVSHLAFQSDAPTLNAVFQQLREYVDVHFTTEEGIWQATLGNDPSVVGHHETHGSFVDEILRLKAEEATKPFETVIENIVNFLTRWLALHILESDRRMALLVQGVERGLTLEQAKQEAAEVMSGSMRKLIEAVLTMYDKLASRTVQMTREINRRRQAEAALQAAYEALVRAKSNAESISEAKSSFLANMSHEIRTPIGAILGMVDLMQQDALSAPQHQRLKHIEDAGKHLLSVVNGILDLSKIEAGKLTLEEAPLDLRELVSGACSMLAHQAEAKGLTLRTELDLPCASVIGDATRLRQALINYLVNAVKFTSRGSISVRCRSTEHEDGSVLTRFEVEDTGPGIEPADLARLFQPFEQGSASQTRSTGGTGLGLTITSRLAEMMGGSAGVESEPGRGSRFWFTARLHRAEEAEAPPSPEDLETIRDVLASQYAGTRILLAEDDAINRAIAQILVSRVGLSVECAANGGEAVTFAERNPPALILMDMQMPELDGIEATKRIRAEPWGRKVPIIALTANAFAEDRARCLEAGMDDFVTKPIEPAVLYAKLHHWLACGSREADAR